MNENEYLYEKALAPETIKLVKTTRGYTWEIKIHIKNIDGVLKFDDEALTRLRMLNEKLMDEYGSEVDLT